MRRLMVLHGDKPCCEERAHCDHTQAPSDNLARFVRLGLVCNRGGVYCGLWGLLLGCRTGLRGFFRVIAGPVGFIFLITVSGALRVTPATHRAFAGKVGFIPARVVGIV